ncbi:PadR family transcriptional regulator [Companilactobacillus jidongensis]|uniref:PadR family transcriptional regulator n=1 Tax=Companilactobacillus jidongensis TaxID=2486006 RepID=UPI000F792932|nr:PadR family transcriptional regulator [Companilactobacillus jidongensis]
MPKKRVLPYILLGLINNQTKMSGYQISQEFNHEIGEFWHASHSQIYPELQRMISDGWIEPDDAVKDSKSIFYLITPNGKNVLKEWLSEPLSEKDDLFSLKLYFIKDQDSPLLKNLVQQQLQINSEHYLHLLSRKKLVFSDESKVRDNYGHSLILNRAIEREHNHINWLKNTLDDLK